MEQPQYYSVLIEPADNWGCKFWGPWVLDWGVRVRDNGQMEC